MARARRGRDVERPIRYRELDRLAGAGARELGVAPGARAWRSRSRPGSTSWSRCTRACGRARSRCPSTCATRERAAAPAPTMVVDAPLACTRRAARRRAARARRDGADRAHLGDERRAEGGPAHLRQLPLERDRLGGRARPRSRRALAVHAAARPRRRASRSSLRSAIYGDDRGRPRARFEAHARRSTRWHGRGSRSSASSRRRSRACSTPACAHPPALRCALAGGGPCRRRCSTARAPPASRSARPTG